MISHPVASREGSADGIDDHVRDAFICFASRPRVLALSLPPPFRRLIPFIKLLLSKFTKLSRPATTSRRSRRPSLSRIGSLTSFPQSRTHCPSRTSMSSSAKPHSSVRFALEPQVKKFDPDHEASPSKPSSSVIDHAPLIEQAASHVVLKTQFSFLSDDSPRKDTVAQGKLTRDHSQPLAASRPKRTQSFFASVSIIGT